MDLADKKKIVKESVVKLLKAMEEWYIQQDEVLRKIEGLEHLCSMAKMFATTKHEILSELNRADHAVILVHNVMELIVKSIPEAQ